MPGPGRAAITSDLIKAAQKEGACNYYTSLDLPLAERIARAFEAKYSGVKVRIERTGAERVFQRIGQEYGSKIHRVDIVNSSDAAHLIVWKNQGILAPFVPEDVAKHFPAEHKDPDGMFSSFRLTLCPIAYNTKTVKAEEAEELQPICLDPKWAGKMTKAHPSYQRHDSDCDLQVSRDLGWATSRSSPAEDHAVAVRDRSTKKVEIGERNGGADGVE